jgi:hypothetical protein
MRKHRHVVLMGEIRNLYIILVLKPEGKRKLERSRLIWEDNIKTDLRKIGFGGVEWIQLAQDRDSCRGLVRTVNNFGSRKGGEFLDMPSQEGHCSVD